MVKGTKAGQKPYTVGLLGLLSELNGSAFCLQPCQKRTVQNTTRPAAPRQVSSSFKGLQLTI